MISIENDRMSWVTEKWCLIRSKRGNADSKLLTCGWCVYLRRCVNERKRRNFWYTSDDRLSTSSGGSRSSRVDIWAHNSCI